MNIRPAPVRRPRSWRRPVARIARWLTGAHRPRRHRPGDWNHVRHTAVGRPV